MTRVLTSAVALAIVALCLLLPAGRFASAQNRMAYSVVSPDSGHVALGLAIRRLDVSGTCAMRGHAAGETRATATPARTNTVPRPRMNREGSDPVSRMRGASSASAADLAINRLHQAATLVERRQGEP